MAKITTVINFGKGADTTAIAVISLDAFLNVTPDGKEKSVMNPKDSAYIFVHYDTSKLKLSWVRSSAGMMVSLGADIRNMSQNLSWSQVPGTSALMYLPRGPVSWSGFGNVPIMSQKQNVLSVLGGTPAIGTVTFSINIVSYRLIIPAMDISQNETVPILVVAHMEAL